MTFPTSIYAGDTVSWSEDNAPDTSTGVSYWFRTDAASGATVAGSWDGEKWQFVLSAAISATFVAGNWAYQAVATTPDGSFTIDAGAFTVKQSLAFSANPTAIETRSPAKIRLAEVEAAIDKLATGAQEYRIGSRVFKRPDLDKLMAHRDQLKADVAREKVAEDLKAGRGDGRRLYVRFPGGW